MDKKEYHSYEGINAEIDHIGSHNDSSDKTIELDYGKKRNNKDGLVDGPGQIRVLVAESNDDLRYLYQTCLGSLGLKLEIVDSGDACLNRLFKDTNTKTNNYDYVIINTHLFDIPGLDIAKEIHNKNPKQRIVITTTSSKEHLAKEHLGFVGIDHRDILTIPFRFSEMVSLLKLSRKNYISL